MSSQESAEAKALTDATQALEAEVADLSALEPEIASKLAIAHDQLAHIAPLSVEQVNAVAAVAHTLGGLTASLKVAAGAEPASAAPAPGSSSETVDAAAEHTPEAPAATGGVAEAPAAAPAGTTEAETPGTVPPA